MIIGIDPGLSGAAAALTDLGEFKQVIDLPVVAKLHGKGNQLDATALARWFRGWDAIINPFDDGMADDSIDNVVIERVSAMPGQGVTSMFGFGHTAGIIEGVVSTLGLKFQYITPQSWKKEFGLIGRDKDAARTLAIQRFPHAAQFLSRKKDNGRADALLIALYGSGL